MNTFNITLFLIIVTLTCASLYSTNSQPPDTNTADSQDLIHPKEEYQRLIIRSSLCTLTALSLAISHAIKASSASDDDNTVKEVTLMGIYGYIGGLATGVTLYNGYKYWSIT